MGSVTFPLSLPTDDHGFLRSSHWTSLPVALIANSSREASGNESIPPFHIDSIRATELNDGSKVQIIISYMLIVVACNILKLVAMWKLWRSQPDELLATVGDAVQSFLQRPDRSTIGLCLMDRQTLIKAFEREQRRRTADVAFVYQLQGGERRVLLTPREDDSALGLPLHPSPKMKHTPALAWDRQTKSTTNKTLNDSYFRWMKASGMSVAFHDPERGKLLLTQMVVRS